MLDRLKSLPLTIVLTILLWMYAEAQFTATGDNIHSAKVMPGHEDLVLVPGVPVWISGPPAVLSRYDVVLEPKVIEVSVAGSPMALQTLRAALNAAPTTRPAAAADLGVHAYLDISPADQPSDTLQTRKLRYALPENLSLHEAPQDISFRLIAH